MHKQFVLVVYDIPVDNRRRTKLHNLLLDYGSPVQYSVFECILNDEQVDKMKKAIKKITRSRKDNLRYYYLCADCVGKIETLQGEAGSESAKAIVV